MIFKYKRLIIYLFLFILSKKTFGNDKIFVSLTSDPDFADVFINGKYTCISPCKVNLRKGRHTVEMKHLLAGNLKKDIEVLEDGEIQSFHIKTDENFLKNTSENYDHYKKELFKKPTSSFKLNKTYITILSFLTASVGLYYIKNKIDQKETNVVIIPKSSR